MNFRHLHSCDTVVVVLGLGLRPIIFLCRVAHLRKAKKFALCSISSNHPLVSLQTIGVQIIACTNAPFVTNGVAKHVTIEQMVPAILTSPKVKSTKAMLM